MKMELSMHRVTSIKVHAERYLKTTYVKTLRVIAENGSTFDLALFSEDKDSLEIKDAANPILEALEALVDQFEEESDLSDYGFTPVPSCNECTQGCTPYNLEKTCAYHAAKKLIKTARGE